MTTRREKLVVLKNAAANLVRGSASAAVAIVLPPFLTRSMSVDAFAAWSLVLQLSAYVGYLDFGIQTAISRFVAHSTERGDSSHRDAVVSTASACLTGSGCVALVGLAMLALLLPKIFHHLPQSMVFDIRVSILLVGGSLAAGLPASVFAGTFVGLQRNEVPAAIIGSSRLVCAGLLILVVRNGGSIANMALCVATVNICSYALQYAAYRKVVAGLVPTVDISTRHVSMAAARELLEYCFSLTVWGVGLLLVTGLDLSIVGIFRFSEVGYYSIAATVVTFLAGVFGAIFSAIGSPAAVVHARGDREGLGRLVGTATRFGMVLLLATGLPLILLAHWLLRIWIGSGYASHAAILLQVLVAANIIRICMTPYVLAMIGSGEQRRVILVPLVEGITNVISSLILVRYLGGLGVAIGTLVGAIVGVAGNIFYNIRRTSAIQLDVREYVEGSLLRPCFGASPIIIGALLWHALPSRLLQTICAIAGSLASIVLLWRVSLVPGDRTKVKELIKVRSHAI